MKNILFFVLGIFLFSGCTPEIPSNSKENTSDIEFGDAVDLTNLFAQVCESSSGPCKNISCTLSDGIYNCYENISKRNENCSSIKTKDEVISKYRICGLGLSDSGNELDPEKYSIFNYSQSLDLLEMGETPKEFEKKIQEEVSKVEEGGTSDFLSTLLAVAGGSILGGMISNALFNSPSAIPPKMNSTYEQQPFDKKKLEESKKSTSENSSKIKDSVSKTKQKSYNTSRKGGVQKASPKKTRKTQTTKKSSLKKRRTFRRRR